MENMGYLLAEIDGRMKDNIPLWHYITYLLAYCSYLPYFKKSFEKC
jgi:hypothetical protein